MQSGAHILQIKKCIYETELHAEAACVLALFLFHFIFSPNNIKCLTCVILLEF
jgi:hypothetical protein